MNRRLFLKLLGVGGLLAGIPGLHLMVERPREVEIAVDAFAIQSPSGRRAVEKVFRDLGYEPFRHRLAEGWWNPLTGEIPKIVYVGDTWHSKTAGRWGDSIASPWINSKAG